jgi:hypothetical protein
MTSSRSPQVGQADNHRRGRVTGCRWLRRNQSDSRRTHDSPWNPVRQALACQRCYLSVARYVTGSRRRFAVRSPVMMKNRGWVSTL